MKALELYCGIGGFTAATRDLDVEVVGAIDISPHVVQAYNANWNPVAEQQDILSLNADDLAAFGADLWWMSPPCAPYTRRGNKEDLDDHRAASFVHLLDLFAEVRPSRLALENVEGFADSRARDVLLQALAGYEVEEIVLCPSTLGVPNLRPRYYLAASREGVAPLQVDPSPLASWRTLVDDSVDPERFVVPDRIIEKYGDGFRVAEHGTTYTTCFTGSYGKSWNFTGSYLRLDDGRLRRFTPEEVLAFLGFPDRFVFPEAFSLKQRWKYAGNSLSAAPVRHVVNALN